MTASIVSEHAVAPLVLCRAGLHLVKSDGVANVLGRVSTRVIRPVVRRHTNYGVDWERHPLVLWGDEAVRPDLGLRWVLEERARRIGREVRVDRECSPFCELVMPPGYAGTCTELLSWIADHELGLIHYASNVGLAHLLREVIRVFRPQSSTASPQSSTADPELSIAVLFGSDRQRQRTTVELSPAWIGGSLLRADRVYDAPPCVAVGTFKDFDRRDVGLHNYGLVLVPRATDALNEHAQEVLSNLALHCRLIGFMPEGEGCSPFQKGRLMATFGPSQFFVPKWGCIERPVQYARLRAPNCPVQNHEHDVRFLREAVWRNDRLNSFIAHAAKAIATGRVSHLPLQPDSPDLGTVPSVILAVDNVEHAAELARRLQGWSVDCGADPHTEGLSPRGLRVLRRALQSAPRPESRMRIMTADALRTHGIGDAGVLVWCGTSGGLPPIPRSSLLAESGTRFVTQPLLLIDLIDRAHPELRRRSQEREWLQ